MNPSQAVGLDNYTRFFVVLALLAALCNLDFFYEGTKVHSVRESASTFEPEPEPQSQSLSMRPYVVTDRVRLQALARVIRTEFKIGAVTADKLARTSLRVARETGVSETLLLAVGGVESSLQADADNGVDKGIMQVNPLMHPEKVAKIGGERKLFDPYLGMLTGARVVKEYTKASKGDQVATLLRYNGAARMNKYPGKVLKLKYKFDRALLLAARS